MSLKAGRVGVAPDQVDDFGVIKSEATGGYTKQEADAKFETKTNANTEYAKLQPKTLSVPISMLQGSLLVPKTTVEDVIQTMDNAMTNRELTDAVTQNETTIELETGITKWTENVVCKQGKFCFINLTVSGSFPSNTEVLVGTIPVGYRPRQIVFFPLCTTSGYGYVKVEQDGKIKLNSVSANATNVGVFGTWLVS